MHKELIDFEPLNWNSIHDSNPQWGMRVLVYRGHCDKADSWKYDNLPPVFEVTNKFDNMITHWTYLLRPNYSFYEESGKSAKSDI